MLDRFAPPDEPVTVAHCAWCGREIYAGTEVHRVNDRDAFVHMDCAKDFAFERVYDAEGTITTLGDVE
jgi:hypothetical protein